MEQYNQDGKRPDNNLLVLTHLSQLLTYISGFGGQWYLLSCGLPKKIMLWVWILKVNKSLTFN